MTAHGWGFPLNAHVSHFFLNDHALCDPILMYVAELDVWPQRPSLPRCSDCDKKIIRSLARKEQNNEMA